jgi:flagellar protein FliO/FliZ
MADLLLYAFLIALLALAVAGGLLFMRGSLGGGSPMVTLFGQRPEKRLAVVEHASLDGRRRLVLVRRDDVEHLIMTGGPVDVVIETGIGAETVAQRHVESSPPVFSRQPRSLGRAAATPEVAE